jgi:rhamnosyl/mannosyltransferase
MIKVLHCFKTYVTESKGGIEQVIFQLAEGCSEFGIESQVFYLSKEGPQDNIPVGSHFAHTASLDFYLASTGFSFSALKKFMTLVKTVDIVHYHFPWPYMDLLHFMARVKKPAVVSYHSDIVKQKYLLKLYEPLMHRFLGKMESIFVSSPNYVNSSPVLPRYAEKVSMIPFGLDESTYPTPEPALLDRWRKNVGPRFFLFVGALRYYKGLDFLIEAARLTQLPLVIVGGGFMEEELRERVASLGLTNISFLGKVTDADKNALLTLCEAFVFPSHLRSESFGVSLLEAAMFGKPLICCEIGTGTTYINIAGETGHVVPPADAEALADAMNQVWADPDRSAEMGRRARQRYEQVFSIGSMVASYAEAYHKVIGK